MQTVNNQFNTGSESHSQGCDIIPPLQATRPRVKSI